MSQWQGNPQDPDQPFVPEHGVITNSPLNPNYRPPKNRRSLKVTLIVVGAFVALMVAAALAGGGSANDATKVVPSPSAVSTTTDAPSEPAVTPTSEPSVKPSPRVTHKPAPKLTRSQEQAVGAAQQYLEVSAFSRKGLIAQLTSDYGSGFSVKDATFAVDHLRVDWNEQAVLAAKSYLEVSDFSRSGLIKQLESPYGGQFTHAEAVYGVSKAGL